jgi:2,3-bisphosphoglycerate-independent phosphoglycerate mutase
VSIAAEGNALELASTPTIDQLRATTARTILQAAGRFVGLPLGFSGNSEVGHETIGAGRTVWQPLGRIYAAIESGEFAQNTAILNRLQPGQPVHLIGLVSDGGVHSHLDHLPALLELAQKRAVGQICIHAITDGRDTDGHSAAQYLTQIEKRIAELGLQDQAKIVSISGRESAMDRDRNWQRTERFYRVLERTSATIKSYPDWQTALTENYAAGRDDEKIEPGAIGEAAAITANSQIIIWNYRSDRSKQLADALTQPKFAEFARSVICPNLTVFGPYSELAEIAFQPEPAANHLTEWLNKKGVKIAKIAETEKYKHVTKFFNNQEDTEFPNETRTLVPSKKVNYAEVPTMSASEVTEQVLAALQADFGLIVVNYANPDMVGHTGDLTAAIQAMEIVDQELATILAAAQAQNCAVIVTADHGNAERMRSPATGEPWKSHTDNPVECFILDSTGSAINLRTSAKPGLADLAPTILALLGIEQPAEMTGQSLLAR